MIRRLLATAVAPALAVVLCLPLHWAPATTAVDVLAYVYGCALGLAVLFAWATIWDWPS